MSAPSSAPRSRRWFERTLSVVVLTTTFALALVAGLVLHINTPVVRSSIAELANSALAQVLYGRVEIERIEQLSLDTVALSRVTLWDPDGVPVIVLEQVRAQLDVVALLEDVWLEPTTLNVVLQHTRVEHSEVRLIPDGQAGELTLSRALTPRPRPARTPSDTAEERTVRVWMPHVELGNVVGELGLEGWSELSPRLSNVRGQVLFSPKGIVMDVERFGANIDGVYGKRVHGSGSLSLRAPGPLKLEFSGFAGDAEVQAHLALERGEVTADVSLPRLTPEAMRDWLKEWPITTPISASVRAQGVWPELTTSAQVSAGSGRIELDGALDFTQGLDASLQADVDHLVLQQVIEHAPELRLDLKTRALIELRGERYRVVLDGSSQPTTLDGIIVPSTRFELEATRREDQQSLVGKLELLEPGGTVSIDGTYGDEVLNAELSAPRVQLRGHRRLPRGLSGLSSLSADVTLQQGQLRAVADGRIQRFEREPIRAAELAFQATATASVQRLQDAEVALRVQATELKLDRMEFERAELTARGNRRGANVDLVLRSGQERRVAIQGHVRADLAVTNAKVALRRGAVQLDAEVAHFDWNARVFDVRRLSIQGRDGRLDGHLRLRPGAAQGALSARNLQVARLARHLFGTEVPLRGSFDLDTEFTINQELQRGRLHAVVTDLSVNEWGDSEVKLLAALDGRHLTGALTGSDELGFEVRGNLNAQLGGHALELQSYRTLTGTSEISVLDVPLGPLGLLAPAGYVSGLDGKVGLRALLQRTEPEGFPNAFVELGASVATAELSSMKPPLRLDSFNAYVNAAYAAEERQLNAVATVGDLHGQLLSVNAALNADAPTWAADPSAALRAFMKQPLSVSVNLPRRAIDQLPVTIPGVTGSVEAQLALFGTPEQPRVSVLVNAQDLLAPGVQSDDPLSLNLSGQYAPRTGDVDVSVVAAARGRSVLMGRLDGQAPWHEANADGSTSQARVALDRLPLGLFAPLVEADINGSVSGQLDLQQGTQPELRATLDFADLRSGRAALGNATMHLKGEPGNVLMHFAIDDTTHPLLVRLSADAKTDQVPLPDQLESVNVAIRAQRVDAAALSPMLESVVARLGGELDADLTVFLSKRLSVEPGVPHQWQTSISGQAELSEGSGYVDALGLELRDVSVGVKAEPKGRTTTLEFDDFRARARSQDINLEGQGQLSIADSRVQSGSAALRLRSVPITLQGLNLGRARGQALAKFERRQGWDRPDQWQGKEYIRADVELLDWEMEAAASASRQLIDLDDNPEIIVIQTREQEEPDPELTPLRVVVHLSDRTLFRLADVEIPLQGDIRVDVTDESAMGGVLVLRRGGRIPIFGQLFRIVDGKLRLNPKDPSNPALDITLVGRSSNDEPVYVTIGGTLQEIVIQPGPAELQALLGGGAATVLGSGVQALGVNQLLGNSIQLRVASPNEEAAEASYGASIQLDDNLWFEATYQRNQNATLNQEQSEIVSGTLDYRFFNNWSWRTKVGNTGGSVDLLWQYRY